MGFYDTEASITTRPHEQKTAYPRSSFVESGHRAYSPTLGRWLNRDPTDEGGGINLLGFTYNAPTVWLDALGLTATKPCCCCCVDDISQVTKSVKKILWNSKLKDKETKEWGYLVYLYHVIDITIALSYPHTDEELSDCGLKWDEASKGEAIEHPVTGDVIVPDKWRWTNITGYVKNGIGAKWKQRTPKCRGKENVPITDKPGYTFLGLGSNKFTGAFAWSHWIRITVTSSPEPCPCKYDSIVMLIKRKTSWDGPIKITGAKEKREEEEKLFDKSVKLELDVEVERKER